MSADDAVRPVHAEGQRRGLEGLGPRQLRHDGRPDNVSIGPGIDASPFVKNASNPAPGKTLPQGFSMTQKLHAKTFPAGTLDDAPFTTTDHVRTLEEQGGKLR